MRRAVRAIVFKDNQLLVMKRNKFGKEYYTLPGGGISIGEVPEQTLRREMHEETGVQIGSARPVFIEQPGDPYGLQYIYLCDYLGGEPALNPNSLEAKISTLGKNLYEPMWLPVDQLEAVNFLSERLKKTILHSIKSGFPAQPQEVA